MGPSQSENSAFSQVKRRRKNGSQDSSIASHAPGAFDTNRFCTDLKRTIGHLQTRNSADDRDKLAVLLSIMCEEIEAKNAQIEAVQRKERRTAKKFDGMMQEVALLRSFKHDQDTREEQLFLHAKHLVEIVEQQKVEIKERQAACSTHDGEIAQLKEREFLAVEQGRRLKVQLVEEQTRASDVEQRLRAELADKERQLAEQKELVRQCMG